MTIRIAGSFAAGCMLLATSALADNHLMVTASDQDVSGGTVTADSVMTTANGWLVVHRTDADHKPGPVIGHAPLKAGENMDVTALLTEEVDSGDMLMLMIHGEEGGIAPGIFEYSLGATQDGPIRENDQLVMTVVHAE